MNDRTFIIAGHIGSGKTTLLAQILKTTNAIQRAEKTILDYDPIEQSKNMTINLKVFKQNIKIMIFNLLIHQDLLSLKVSL
jgi:translation elongation factor EF-G